MIAELILVVRHLVRFPVAGFGGGILEGNSGDKVPSKPLILGVQLAPASEALISFLTAAASAAGLLLPARMVSPIFSKPPKR